MIATEIVLRPCRPDETDAVLELWRSTRGEHASTPDRADDLRRLLSRDPGSLIVADAGGSIVGAVIAACDGWRGNLYRLAVNAGYRRRGVALALVRAGEAHLRRRGIARVTALVAFADEAAASFWDAAGYPRDRAIGRRVRNLRPSEIVDESA